MENLTELNLADLAARLGGKLDGDGNRTIAGAASLGAAGPEEVSFLANARYEKHMAETSAGAVIVASNYAGPRADGVALIRCDDPYFAFREAMVLLYGFREVDFVGVDERAAVDPSAKLAGGVAVAPFATICAGCEVGANTAIYPGVYLGAGCKVGADCIIHPNVTLYDGTILHDRVTVHAGTSIGHDGFGYATHTCEDGVVRHDKIPQAGWVEIEDDVEIGACCAIDRASVGSTVIGAGTKFSNLIAIGHGTKMGRHCLMVAQAGIAGSVAVGNYCVFAGQCGVVGHISIGDGARVGAKAGVTNDIEPGMEVLGSPAVPRTDAKRALVGTSQIPRMRNALRKLTNEMAEIKRRLGMDADKSEEANDG